MRRFTMGMKSVLIEPAVLGFLSIDMSPGLKYLAGPLTYDVFADNSTYVSICCKVGDNGVGHQCPVFKQTLKVDVLFSHGSC